MWEYRQQLVDGTLVTIQLALASLIIAILFGLLGAMGKLSSNRIANMMAGIYTTAVRGVPDLVLILLVFYGGQEIINTIGKATDWWKYVEINQFMAGTCTIGVIFGAYYTETFRGAIMAIPKGQIEAGVAVGMNKFLVFRHIIWPQMIRYALPGFSNNWLVQIKTTALVSVIGLQDLVYNAFVAGRSTHLLFIFMFASLVIFLLMTAISDLLLTLLNRKYSKGMVRT
ncbi:MAG: ABC transporter permease [Rhizobiales bacterium]|nr:ABC transporter permease [Hyphomicrobiales bacterium]